MELTLYFLVLTILVIALFSNAQLCQVIGVFFLARARGLKAHSETYRNAKKEIGEMI